MGIIKNAVPFGSGFNIGASGPIDSRMRVAYKTDLTTVWGADAPSYAGMVVSVLEEDKIYVLKNNGFDDNGLPLAADYWDETSWICIGENDGVNEDAVSEIVRGILTDGKYIDETKLTEELSKINIPITDITSGETSLIKNKTIDLSEYYYSKTEIDNKLNSFDLFVIVSSLPTEEIDENKIYVINSNSTGEENIYSEYIYVENKWEKIGEFKSDVDLSNYCTKDELVTNSIKLSSDIKTENEQTAKYASGSTVQYVLSDMHSRLNTINTSLDVAISGGVTSIQEGDGIDVDDSTNTSPKVSIKISEDENNALTYGEDKGLYVEDLKTRLKTLEDLLSSFTGNDAAEFITTKNINQHAITSIIYDNTVREDEDMEDIVIKNNNGEIKIALNSITNIAFGDAEDITKNN